MDATVMGGDGGRYDVMRCRTIRYDTMQCDTIPLAGNLLLCPLVMLKNRSRMFISCRCDRVSSMSFTL